MSIYGKCHIHKETELVNEWSTISRKYISVCPECQKTPSVLAQMFEKKQEDIECPFCGENDFDKVGLMLHLDNGHCDGIKKAREDFQEEFRNRRKQ
jgi:RNA polymerase subunit RPABC4/transcription elongation factor Spt4